MTSKELNESWNNYKSLFGRQECPECGERCISYFKKLRLPSKITWNYYENDHTCPNCHCYLRIVEQDTRISTVVLRIAIIIVALVWIVNIITYFLYQSVMPEFVLEIIEVVLIFCDVFLLTPFNKIEVYDSTPMDDMIVKLNKPKKMWRRYKSLYKRQMCPACGERTITYYRKLGLSSSIYNIKCPECKERLILSGVTHIVMGVLTITIIIYTFILLIVSAILNQNVANIYWIILLLAVGIRLVFRYLVYIPYAYIIICDISLISKFMSKVDNFKMSFKKMLKRKQVERELNSRLKNGR